MIATTDTGDVAVLMGVFFTGLSGIVAAIFAGIAAVRSGHNGQISAKIHEEVKTMNGLRLGELADNAETRRVENIDPSDRTLAEAVHLAVVPPKTGEIPLTDVRNRPLPGG